MLVDKENITQYIPQRKPIVMVDGLLSVDATKGSAIFTIPSDNMFVEAGQLQAPGIIEHIAQSAALRAGYQFKSQGKEIPIGFIGALKKLDIVELPKVSAQLKTEITIKNQVFDITLIEAIVLEGDQTIATCEMKIFIAND